MYMYTVWIIHCSRCHYLLEQGHQWCSQTCWRTNNINLVSKCEVMASNSLLQNRSKYLEARSELLFRIRGLHIGAHHGNVVSLWGHVVGKRHTGYIDIWRCKPSITYAYSHNYYYCAFHNTRTIYILVGCSLQPNFLYTNCWLPEGCGWPYYGRLMMKGSWANIIVTRPKLVSVRCLQLLLITSQLCHQLLPKGD